MLQALIFDFDGLIIDTEWSEFQSWQEMYQQHGVELSLEDWLPSIGRGATTQVYDPCDALVALLEQPVDGDVIRAQCKQRHLELIEAQAILPGVEELILEAKRRGLGLAVASSSSRKWVAGHLGRLGLLEHFDSLSCGDETTHAKPYPDLYLSALEKLGVQADQAVAFEDSLNGMLAAQRAGIFCVVVPNPLTRHLHFEDIDLRLTSLAELSLDELVERFARLIA
jgi:HAD superfamily hydrolase (TIGR01509 family)